MPINELEDRAIWHGKARNCAEKHSSFTEQRNCCALQIFSICAVAVEYFLEETDDEHRLKNGYEEKNYEKRCDKENRRVYQDSLDQ